MRQLVTIAFLLAASYQGPPLAGRDFTLSADAEVVVTITARCPDCDWSQAGREAVLLELTLDGVYSQHLALTRGREAAPYRVLLGTLSAGAHQLTIRRDTGRSAPRAGPAIVDRIGIEVFTAGSPEHRWLSRAPILRARPGTIDRFSDFPLLMYVETDVGGEGPGPYRYQYTVIFSHEDGGTATDRLMATWGRTTDVEFVFGVRADDAAAGPLGREVIQAEGHEWVPFDGPRRGAHPILWVATDNNMVAAHGPEDTISFAPAPQLVSLKATSREAVMDAEPWTYAVTSAEMAREGRVDPGAGAGSGKIPDPRRYAVIEACADVKDATLAFDIGVRGSGQQIAWHATDRDEPRFRIARGGCFRGGAPLPPGVEARDIAGLRVRAYTRPARAGEEPLPAGAGQVVLRQVNRVFMLDPEFKPALSSLTWTGVLPIGTDGTPVQIPLRR